MPLDALKKRIAEIEAAPAKAASAAAPRIQATLRRDATTRRGNVPQFSPGPDGTWRTAPIEAALRGASSITVVAPAWVHAIARREGQPKKWRSIVREELARALKGGA